MDKILQWTFWLGQNVTVDVVNLDVTSRQRSDLASLYFDMIRCSLTLPHSTSWLPGIVASPDLTVLLDYQVLRSHLASQYSWMTGYCGLTWPRSASILSGPSVASGLAVLLYDQLVYSYLAAYYFFIIRQFGLTWPHSTHRWSYCTWVSPGKPGFT